MKKVLIIGGGASGLIAALTATEAYENRVILLERQARVGRKLLSTGNGRCNLTNMNAGAGRYHGEDEAFPLFALGLYPPGDNIAFFQKLGLLTVTEPDGRVYPLSDSANSVLDVLRLAAEGNPRIEIRTSSPVISLSRENDFTAVTEKGAITGDVAIVACGGAAGAALGGVMDGYKLLQSLGHARTALLPSLVQIRTEAEYPRALKGVRADARISVKRGGTPLASSCGEVQFTERGVSGPAAFDISRAASAGGAGLSLELDFLRAYEAGHVYSMLSCKRKSVPSLTASELFTGALHNRLGRTLIKYAGLPGEKTISELSDAQIKDAASAAKGFLLSILGTEGFERAQVTAGGARTSEFNPETLESRIVPGLFACGEVLDIDGDCGGYNLQWAWSSGRLAGRLGR